MNLRVIIRIFFILLLIAVGGLIGYKIKEGVGEVAEENKIPVVTNSFIDSKLDAISNLTTAELSYNGIIRYEEGDIPLINKKGFVMKYFAQIKAGIDVAEIDVKITDKEVVLKVPEAKVQDVKIDEESIEFFDETNSLFNWADKEDTIDAMKLAKEDVKEKANVKELKAKADEQTKVLLTGLIGSSIGEKSLIIQTK